MTDLDTPPNNELDLLRGGRPSFWRVLSLGTVLATVVLVAIAVLQARSAGDLEAESRKPPIELDTTRVTLGAVDAPDSGQLLALGLDPTQYTADVVAGGARVDVPADSPALVALSGPDGSIHGLALIRGAADRPAVEISADSTARAVLALSPALLQPDFDLAFDQVDVIAQDPAFENLVAALLADSNISQTNPMVETALAEILDRVPNREPFSDQGCDSVLDPNAYAVTGACVEPNRDGVTINNEQDRWALLYATGTGELCGTVAPSRTPGSVLNLSPDQCGDAAIMVAPGPIVDRAISERAIVERVRAAAAVQLFSSYVTPFADLAAGAAGFSSDANAYISGNSEELVTSFNQLGAQDPAFDAALDTLVNPSTRADRNTAGISAARVLIAAVGEGAPVPDRAALSDGYVDLLDFFVRTGERMTKPKTDWRWTADSVGEIAVSELGS